MEEGPVVLRAFLHQLHLEMYLPTSLSTHWHISRAPIRIHSPHNVDPGS